VVVLLKENPELKIEVQGHTDDQGSEDYNLKLSQRRAETVVTYLSLFGIDPNRLMPKGFGESQPIMPNTTEEGRAKNRRVELVKVASQDLSLKEGAPKDIARTIVGKWEMAANKRATKGSISFDTNGAYELQESLQDGTEVGAKGEYNLDTSSTPIRIDLCLDKCGKPGSEWTTRFGILRILSGEKMEIRTSPDGKYPSSFSDDTNEEHTMILTRIK
jgi:hypothetical protein